MGSLEVAMDNPVLGVGPGMVTESDEMRLASGRGRGFQVHNAWLELMVEAGVPAFMFMAIAMASIMGHSFRMIRLLDDRMLPLVAVTLAFFAILLAETSLSYITSPTLWVWFFILLLLQAELTKPWETNAKQTTPDQDDLDVVSG